MGELEAKVMEVLWSHDGAMKPGEVHKQLARGRELAYTTVMTILVRLWGKGLLERQREGRAYVYRPVESRAAYAARRMREILESAGSQAEALASFVESMTRSDRARLRRLLERTSK